MTTVSVTNTDSVAVLTICNPPVNMGNAEMRSDLLAAVTEAGSDPSVTGIVLVSALMHFYAGSDITEFAGELSDPQLPDVISAIEELEVPVVAAISGLALGGGLEFALGCDYRIGDETAILGFPEVTLGMLPGAGGTVRTPRLTGVPAAVDLVSTARRVDAQEALELGLLDEVVPSDRLLRRAVEVAASAEQKSRVADLPVPAPLTADVDAVVERVSRRARPNVLAAVDLVLRTPELDQRDALAAERAAFHRFRLSDEAASLRYLFFSSRAAAKSLRSSASPRPLGAVGIAGAGTMGSSLARAFAGTGVDVVVFDRNLEALERVSTTLQGVRTTGTIDGLGGCDLVIDAVFEDLGVKKDLMRELEPVLHPEAVIASNTSYLDLRVMASVLDLPGRFGGLHFFNPPHRNPLVEVIRTPLTDDPTFATLVSAVSALDKVGIPAGIGDGFVANRVYADYRAQAEFLVEEGASPAEVDSAMKALGMAMGPFAVADMSGLDIAWARRKRLAADRDPAQRYVSIPDRLCEAGRLGQKTGAGWYSYPHGARRGEADPAVDAIINAERQAKGITPRSIGHDEISERILASMLCAAAGLVEAGIAERASDIDVAMTEGFAFPRALGGPVYEMSARATEDVILALAAVYKSCPVSFTLAEPAAHGQLPEPVARCFDQVRSRR